MVVLFIILGCVFASFYTALAMRLSNGESIVKPGSHCNMCNHSLKWYDLFPVFSFVFLKGKCRYCHKDLDKTYVLMELLGGFLFAACYLMYGISYELLAMLIVSSLLMIIYVSDFKYLIILDGVVYVGFILIIVLKYIYFGLKVSLLSFASGILLFLFMLLIKLIGDKLFKRESLGGGDIKLALFIGSVLGIKLALVSIVIASFITLPYALYYLYKKKEREVPFGPFLITATFITFMFMEPFSRLLNYLFIID